jgi:hypothetical protein
MNEIEGIKRILKRSKYNWEEINELIKGEFNPNYRQPLLYEKYNKEELINSFETILSELSTNLDKIKFLINEIKE